MPVQIAPWLVAVLVLVVTACAADVGASDDPTPAPTPSETPVQTLAMNWTAAFEVALPNGWVVRDCEGERTNVCVWNAGTFLGDIELLAGYPLDEDQVGEEPQTILRAWAQDFVEHFREDRAKGCAAFAFAGEEVTDVAVGGQFATKAAFSLTDASGQVVERVVTHYTLLKDTVAVVNTDAYVKDGGCLGPSEYDPSFSPEHLSELEPYLDRLIADTPLPPGADHR